MNTRQRWLALALVVTVVAAFWPAQEDDVGDIEVIKAGRSGSPRPAPTATPDSRAGKGASPAVMAEPAARFVAAKAGNLFPRQTWAPPPPPPPPPPVMPPPPAPTPPPLPYSYLGHWTEAGKITFFLAQGDQVHQISKGAVLAGVWRLDSVSTNRLDFTYLPLDMTRTLRIAP
jgi:hypothetical protein